MFSDPADRDRLFSEEEVRVALSSYAAANQLSVAAGRIKLDRLLAGALYNKKEPQASLFSSSSKAVLILRAPKTKLLVPVEQCSTSQGGKRVCFDNGRRGSFLLLALEATSMLFTFLILDVHIYHWRPPYLSAAHFHK